MGKHIDDLDRRLALLDPKLTDAQPNNPIRQMLAEIPGLGPVIASTTALRIEAQNFASGRHFAAWLGLPLKDHTTGGKQRMGRISKAAKLARGPRHRRHPFCHAKAAALANKMARIIWAMIAQGESSRRETMTAA